MNVSPELACGFNVDGPAYNIGLLFVLRRLDANRRELDADDAVMEPKFMGKSFFISAHATLAPCWLP